jgi:hypothetical protein
VLSASVSLRVAGVSVSGGFVLWCFFWSFVWVFEDCWELWLRWFVLLRCCCCCGGGGGGLIILGEGGGFPLYIFLRVGDVGEVKLNIIFLASTREGARASPGVNVARLFDGR